MFAFAVYADGGICLDILQNQWSPIYDVAAILTSIQVHIVTSNSGHAATVPCAPQLQVETVSLLQSLLSDPNPNSPANAEAARLYGENRCVSVLQILQEQWLFLGQLLNQAFVNAGESITDESRMLWRPAGGNLMTRSACYLNNPMCFDCLARPVRQPGDISHLLEKLNKDPRQRTRR